MKKLNLRIPKSLSIRLKDRVDKLGVCKSHFIKDLLENLPSTEPILPTKSLPITTQESIIDYSLRLEDRDYQKLQCLAELSAASINSVINRIIGKSIDTTQSSNIEVLWKHGNMGKIVHDFDPHSESMNVNDLITYTKSAIHTESKTTAQNSIGLLESKYKNSATIKLEVEKLKIDLELYQQRAKFSQSKIINLLNETENGPQKFPVGEVYSSLGKSQLQLDQVDAAIRSHIISLEHMNVETNPIEIMRVYVRLPYLYARKGDLNTARFYIERLFSLSQAYQNHRFLSYAYTQKFFIELLTQNNLDQIVPIMNKAKNHALLSESKVTLLEYYWYATEYSLYAGKYSEAIDNLATYKQIHTKHFGSSTTDIQEYFSIFLNIFLNPKLIEKYTEKYRSQAKYDRSMSYAYYSAIYMSSGSSSLKTEARSKLLEMANTCSDYLFRTAAEHTLKHRTLMPIGW